MLALETVMPSADVVAYLVNLAVAVSLVGGVGLLAARVCHYGSAPLPHGILVWTLVLILVSPVAVWLAQQDGLALVRVTVSGQSNAHEPTIADQPASGVPATAPIQSAEVSATGAATPFVPADRPFPSQSRLASSAGPDVIASEAPDSPDSSKESRSAEESRTAVGGAASVSKQPLHLAWWQVMGSIVALLWAVGTTLGLFRLAWGYAALVRFCCRLDPLMEAREKLLVHQAADAVGLRKLPAVYLSRSAGVPMSIGLLRPAIVLPETMPYETDEAQLQAILLHEMAHVARRDPWVGVGQRIAAALFWWNPLVHWTCDGISDLREEICDNHVVLVQGEGQRLARILVDLAARVTTGPFLPSTIGVMEPRLAGLTGRVTRLLDKERSMETRMSFRSKVFLFSCSLAVLTGIGTVGGLRLAHAQPATDAKPAASDQISDTPAKADGVPGAVVGEGVKGMTTGDSNSDRFDFRGQVLDPDGKPLSGANIYFIFYINHTHPRLPPPKVRATTGVDGQFHFTLDRSEFEAWRAAHPWGVFNDVNFRNDCRLVAQADGFGPVWLPAFAFETSGDLRNRLLKTYPGDTEALGKRCEPVLRVVKDDVPLVGRIVDTKGQPVAGVKVSVMNIMPVKNEDLTGWLSEAERKDADLVKTMKYSSLAYVSHGSFTDGFISSYELPQITPTATSDADGRFRLTGIGRERIVSLSIEGPRIESACAVHARTRLGKTLVIPYQLPWMPEKHTYYGATFEHVARPSVPIVGTVRDKDTGKPLPGVAIQAHKLAGNPAKDHMVSFFVRTTTDTEGRYRLTGMPIGKDNELLLVPPKEQPYLLSKMTVDTSAAGDKDSLEKDFELKQGVWIRGRVTDAKTGKPVTHCLLDYVVFANNPYAKSAPGFKDAYRFGFYETDKDGRYAVRGLPGRGILALLVCGDGETRYPLNAGVEKIPEIRKGGGRLDNQHAFAEVNPAYGVKSVEQDFQLDPGQSLTGAVLDTDGRMLAGAHYSGLTERGGWNPLSSATFTVNCYRPDQPRKLLFIHLERKLAGSLVVVGNQTVPLSVQLQPWGAIAGRIVDAEGKPQGNVDIEDWALPRHLMVKEPNGEVRRVNESFPTDKDGRFRIEGLAPGMKYNLSGWNRSAGKYFGQLVSDVTVESGQTKDLGDVKIKSPPGADASTMRTFLKSTWRVSMNLDLPELDPPAVQYAILDKDPVPGFRAGVQRMRANYQERLDRAEGKAAKDMERSSQMAVLWDLGFKDVTADGLYLLTSGSSMISSNGSDGWKWIVSKTVRVDGKPICWCIPVEVKKGKEVKVTLTEGNAFDLSSTFDKAMQEADPAK
jgi:beta-lactamase regulating signal transducer with metallopeptidase domain/protocatechuate 3,4-dioxygenase beta subunit